MFYTNVANATVHRTLKPLYERFQATPVATFLDPNETGQIFTGMVLAKTGPDVVSLCDGATQVPWGLSALDRNTITINDLNGQSPDLQPFSVWIGGPDAFFTVYATAVPTTVLANQSQGGFDINAISAGVPTDGSRGTGTTVTALYAGTGTQKGLLTSTVPTWTGNAGQGPRPIAELAQVVASNQIIVRLLAPALW